MSKNKNLFIGFLVLLSMIFMIMPEYAFAADLFEIKEGDKSKEMFLDKLFDISSVETLSSSPLNDILLTFNTCVLMIGGILAAYALIAGTMSTAHDGEMLGKKWSAMWLPIRTFVGSAMIFPTMGGFCAAQLCVIWLIHQGVGLANALWTQYVETMPMTSMASYSGPDRDKVFELAVGVLNSNYCRLVADEYYDGLRADNESKGFPKPADYYPKTDTFSYQGNIGADLNTTVYAYGYNLESTSGVALPSWMRYTRNQWKACGAVKFDFSEKSVDGSATNFTLKSLDNTLKATSEGAKKIKDNTEYTQSVYVITKKQLGANNESSLAGIGEVNKVKVTAYKEMDAKLKALAVEYFNSKDKDAMRPKLYQGLVEATNDYSEAAKKSGLAVFYDKATGFENNEYAQTWSEYSKVISDQGWMYAGSWYMQLYRIQNLIGNVSKVVPIYEPRNDTDNITRDDATIKGKMTEFEKNLEMITNEFKMQQSKNVVMNEYKENVGENYSGEGDSEKILSYIKKELTKVTTSVIDYAATNPSYYSSPLSLAYTIGDALEVAFWTLGFGVLLTGLISSGLVVGVVTFLSPLLSVIFIISNMLTVVLPFMPFFLWLGAVLGWAVLCIEAVIAAPLWVMIHIHPDGDGVVGKGGAGYGMVLSLTIRPALMILGLACAMITVSIFAEIVNDMFLTAFYTTANRNGVSILQTPIMIATYAMALLVVIKKSFSLIHVIPDEVLKWLGVNHGGTKEAALGGMQTMMAAKYIDDKASSMSAGNAIAAGSRVNEKKKEDKSQELNKQAAGSIGNDDQKVKDFMEGEGSGSTAGSNLSKAMGNDKSDGTAASQMQEATDVLNKNDKPYASMNQEELAQTRMAHETKSANIENVMKGSGISEDGSVGQRLRAEQEQSNNAISAIDKRMSEMGGGSSAPNPNTPDAAMAPESGQPSGAPGSAMGSESRGNGGGAGYTSGNGGGAGNTRGNGGGAGDSDEIGHI